MRKKMAFIIIGATLLLGGGGAGAFFFLMDKPPEDPAAAAKAQEEADNADLPEGTAPTFVELDSFPVPVMRNGRIHHYLHVALTVEVKDEAAKEELTAIAPQLRHAMLRAASAAALAQAGQAATDAAPAKPPRDEVDLMALAEQVKNEVNSLTGRRTARQVLVRQALPGPA